MASPDILLYLGPGENEELRYAIRTWVENLEFDKLYVVGGPKPRWLQPDIYVENPFRFQKMRQCYDNLRIGLNDERLSDDIILMMDDIFLLQPWGEWRINHNRGTLTSQFDTLVSAFGQSGYTDMIRNTDRELQKTFDAPLSFEEHAPFFCNRHQLWAILDEYGARKMDNMLYRSIYGNRYKIPTEYRKDVKLTKVTDAILAQDTIISTNESSFRGRAGTTIKNWFPNPSAYES